MKAHQQPHRPRSVTIIAWVLIAMGVAWLVTNIANLSNEASRSRLLDSPLPLIVQYIVMYTDLVVMLVSAVGLLRRQNWARYLYVVWGLCNLALQLVAVPLKVVLIPGALVFAIVVFFLFRPRGGSGSRLHN